MNKREIVDTALRGIGMARTQGDTTEPIMPYLLGGIMADIYFADVAKLPLKHKMKEMDKVWQRRYGLFNRPVYSCFKDEDKCELTDLIDSISDHLSNEITMLRSGVMTAISGIEDFNRRKAVSSLLLCHMFAQYANCTYMRVYRKHKTCKYGVIVEEASNDDLVFLRDYSYKMALQYIKETPGGDLEINNINLDSLFSLVAKKIYGWLKEN